MTALRRWHEQSCSAGPSSGAPVRHKQRLAWRLAGDERIQRIGELLCKGILSSPELARPTGTDQSGAVDLLTPEARILGYLQRHAWASPAEMRAVLGLSRTRTHLALQRLLRTNRIAGNGGKTSAAAYRLTPFDASRN